MESNVRPRRKSAKGTIITTVVIIVVAALATMLVIQHLEIKKLSDPGASSEQAKADAAKLKEKVGKIVQLPDGEATVATVQDADKLKEQEFFKDAQNGDKVLIFTEAKKAFIYRESENKVINSGPIVLNSAAVEQPKAEE